MAKEAARLDRVGGNIYFSLNPTIEDLSGRAQNHTMLAEPRKCTTDAQIIAREWLFVDIDAAKGLSDIAATDEQHEAALLRATEIKTSLMVEWNWPAPIVVDSGNGAYLLFRIALENNDANTGLIERVLKALAAKFDNDKARIDTGVFNPSRIARIPGTLNRKGDNTESRPHRRARVIESPPPGEIEIFRREQLEQIAALAPPEAASRKVFPGAFAGSGASEEARMSRELKKVFEVLNEKHGITASTPKRYKDSGWQYFLTACLFNHDHSGGTSVSIIEYESGSKQYSCLHEPECRENNKSTRSWGDVLVQLGLGGKTNGAAGKSVIDSIAQSRQWPEPMAPDAFYGIAGEFVHMVEPYCEGDPAALLLQFLIAFGNRVGRSAHYMVGATRHYLNLFACLVGLTSKSRKGTSWHYTKEMFIDVEPGQARSGFISGLSSGEGLISAVRDPELDIVDNQGSVKRGPPGVVDKRLMVTQGEFCSVLKVMKREGNILSGILRDAWDDGTLRVMTKRPMQATDAHISIIGHITRDELRSHLTETDMANGFANRFLWACVQRSKLLPEGGSVPREEMKAIEERLARLLSNAHTVGRMRRDEEAKDLWATLYATLSEAEMGLVGSVIARAEAQVLRLSCIYALLDGSEIVCVQHLRAALAVWSYCEASCRYIFGRFDGGPGCRFDPGRAQATAGWAHADGNQRDARAEQEQGGD